MKRKKLPLETHRKIGEYLNSETKSFLICETSAYGTTSKAHKLALKLSNTIMHLKNIMEEMAHNDGHGEHALSIYYPHKETETK